jgi:competence protein ComEC
LAWADAPAPGGPADPQAGAGSRYAQVFDRSGDRGKLVARFLRIVSGQDGAGKSAEVGAEKAGDSTILVSPEGLVMLIDGGETSCGPQVVAYLKALGIAKIDVVMVSHPHVDHLGGLPAVLDAFPVGLVYMSRLEYPTGPYAAMLSAIRRHNIPLEYLEEGSAFSFGSSVSAKVYNPGHEIKYYDGYPANSTAFVNGKSLVVRFSYGKSSMLFMGDLYTPGELDLMEKYGAELESGVIKVGHHGNETSSSKSFIKTVSPKLACIINDSVDSVKVYNNYRKAGAQVFVTFLDGCVKISADDAGNYGAVTEQDRASDFLK